MLDDLLPRPRSVDELGGTIVWRSPLRVAVGESWRPVVATFADDLRVAVGWDVAIVGEHDDAEIVIRLDDGVGPEGFRLRVDRFATIEASAPAGVSYALIVLRQLGPAAFWSEQRHTVDDVAIARVAIADEPTYQWQGIHLDVSRHFFDVATVTRLIDLAAAHRLNRLHLHLNDDQGWRVDVPAWPRLREIGSWRSSSPIGHESDGLDDGVAHGGCYSARDLERIRDHAARRFVQVVPEIDLPGHAQAVLAAYGELGNGSTPVEVWTRWGISEHVLNPGPAALDFAEEVVLFVAGLFPALSLIHI